MQPKALIAMSGGVDSAVSAALMQEAGYDCLGVTLRLWCGEGETCGSAREAAVAKEVAASCGIPHRVLDLSDRFRQAVIDPFIASYEAGETPNPCVACNRNLKFGFLCDWAAQNGFDRVVTGHYARVQTDPVSGRYLLKKALDPQKDQSYVLYNLTQEQLARVAFPLGTLTKTEVRRMAEDRGFVNAQKKDSQDICFVPDGDYTAFLTRETGKTYPKGPFVSLDGTPLGEHNGVVRYTVGQRKGLGIAAREPLYVVKVDPKTNTVVLGGNGDLYSDTLTARDCNFISVPSVSSPMRCRAKVRYRQEEQPCTVVQTGDRTVRVTFDTPQRAITPGQSVVVYDGDTVVLGGIIA